MSMMDPDQLMTATTNLIAGVYNDDVFVNKVGEYPWGSVQAPGELAIDHKQTFIL